MVVGSSFPEMMDTGDLPSTWTNEQVSTSGHNIASDG